MLVAIHLTGKVEMLLRNKRTKYDVNMDISSTLMKGKVTGVVDRWTTNNFVSYTSRLNALYTRHGKNHRVVLNNKFKDSSKGDSTKYIFTRYVRVIENIQYLI